MGTARQMDMPTRRTALSVMGGTALCGVVSAAASNALAPDGTVSGGLAYASEAKPSEAKPNEAKPNEAKPNEAKPRHTRFQIACMTLPYSAFPLSRALTGIRDAGFRFVAWGVTHREEPGRNVPVMAPDAPAERARELASRCRELGLEPLMMFSTVYPEHKNAVEVFTRRIEQAAAARIPQVLTFGHTKVGNDPRGNRALWVERFRKLAPRASDAGVMLVIKQHGGETGTGVACAEIAAEVNHPAVAVNYDAGNVMDYLNVDPIPDLAKCAEHVRSFCIKDHRNTPRDEDCGPGFGEIDHYKLLGLVAKTGRIMPLCCENIFAPLLPRPDKPEDVDALARRAREFLETVTAGLACL